MAVIKTKVDRGSDDCDKNREANVALAGDLRALSENVMQGGSKRAREKRGETHFSMAAAWCGAIQYSTYGTPHNVGKHT